MSTINGGEEWRIQVTGDWVSEVTEELRNLTQIRSTESRRWKKASIYKIPGSLRNVHHDVDGSAYDPQMVSIGPYHYGEAQVEGMEKHKRRAVLNLVARSKKPLQRYVDELALVLDDLKDAYDQLISTSWTDEDFLRLMFHDGCFILELMRTANKPIPAGYDCCDPVFSDHGSLYSVLLLKRDLLKLQNQLPLQVLQIIMLVEAEDSAGHGHGGHHQHLTRLILKFLGREREIIPNIRELAGTSLHILDLYRRSLLIRLPSSSLCHKNEAAAMADHRSNSSSSSSRLSLISRFRKMVEKKRPNDCSIPSATVLAEAGVKFVRSGTSNLDDVEFSSGSGVLKLPPITVDDASGASYLNLMAFERCHVDAGNGVTSYVFLMDRLIDSARDVSHLHWRGIIDNLLGSDQAVADLFNSLSTDACIDSQSTFNVVQDRVAEYYRLPVPLPRWKAYAKLNYFANPWISLSIVAAILLFALSILQTVFAILSYYQDQNTK